MWFVLSSLLCMFMFTVYYWTYFLDVPVLSLKVALMTAVPAHQSARTKMNRIILEFILSIFRLFISVVHKYKYK